MAILAIKGVAMSFGGIPRSPASISPSRMASSACSSARRARANQLCCGRSRGWSKLDSGTIEIDGEVVNAWRPHERNVAMVFQTRRAPAHNLGLRQYRLQPEARGVPRADIEQRVKRVAEILGIADLLHRRPDQLQLAERRRVAIGRAAVRDADVCLIDEPLANVDLDARDAMRDEIKLLHREFPTTKLFATHDPFEAMTLGDRVVLMRAGRIEQEGSPLDLFERPLTRFVAGFFGWPKMNFLAGTLAERRRWI